MNASHEWVTTAELLELLSHADYPTTDRQLERWRDEGVLPSVDQENVYRGSVTRHPPETARQVIAIHRCLEAKNRFEFVGPLLWVAGFEVGEQHCADQLRRADQYARWIRPFTRRLLNRFDRSNSDRTLGEAVELNNGLTGILAKMFRRLGNDRMPTLINDIADVAAGEFDQFNDAVTDHEVSTKAIFNRAFGFDRGSNDQILGAELRLGQSLEGTLSDLSKTNRTRPTGGLSAADIRSARDDVRNALKIATCLYNAAAWIYGPDAFGLRLPAYFARVIPTASIYFAAVSFAQLRKSGADMYSSAEIADMAHQAERAWLISEYFHEQFQLAPELVELIAPNGLKAAFGNGADHRKMLKELKSYQFPTPEFKPWNRWQKLAKRKMTPGLLVMSIGSPERLSLEEVTKGANPQGAP
jgi:hypothetical protein